MSADRNCPNCGAPLAGDAPEGNCPNCLLQLALLPGAAGSAGPMPSGSTGRPNGPQPGDRIGRYKLLQQIGEGGCGVVFMAEQEEPLRRRVALKVVKLGMDTKNVIARFEAERQALALMDHPHIAKVLDAGATDTGRPFFVMELVRGVKLTDYCDQNHLPTRQRLDLFIQVCRAIQHAHQKGIIHRDIKPSNILVTMNDGVPMPKVIDFGIAKATTDQPLTDKTVFTAFEQFLGTPAYMSPEQAEMSALDIDTRSDIYSLGVLLYELLTGQTPFDARELLAAGWDGIRRTIREQEPDAPSNRLKTMIEADLTAVAERRQAEPARLTNLVRGDLDWIVMKALEKDRTRRYETVNGLAMDVQRYLANEPVLARPPTRLYQMQKMMRRNKLAFTAAAAVLAALVVGLGTSTYLFLQEREARRAERRAVLSQNQFLHRAEEEEARSRQVAQYLKGLLEAIAPSLAKMCHPQYVRNVLDQAGDRVDRELDNQPDVEVEVRTTFGLVHAEVGQYDKAASNFKRVLRIRERRPGKNDADIARSLRSYVEILWRQHKTAELEDFLSSVPTPAESRLPMTAAILRSASLGCHYPAELLVRGGSKASWSPDSDRIVFAKSGGGLAVLDLPSRRLLNLSSQGNDPAWSPDGRWIAYVTSPGAAYYSEQVWLMAATGGPPVKLGQGGFPAWSADSRQVFFRDRNAGRILCTGVDAKDARPSVFFEGSLSWYPAISADGDRIAFGGSEHLIVVERQTGRCLVELPAVGERGLLPAWSPDGRRVGFGGLAGSPAGLWVCNVEQRGAFQVAQSGCCTMPAWSPNGRHLAFDYRGETNEIWMLETRDLPPEPSLVAELPPRPAEPEVDREMESPVLRLVGHPIPGSFKLPLLEGGDLMLPAAAPGEVLLLDFCATWCAPCREAMPVLADIGKAYASRGVRYVVIDQDEAPEAIRRYLSRTKLEMCVALDRECAMAKALQVRAIPTVLVVDRSNTVRHVQVGRCPKLAVNLRKALDEVVQK